MKKDSRRTFLKKLGTGGAAAILTNTTTGSATGLFVNLGSGSARDLRLSSGATSDIDGGNTSGQVSGYGTYDALTNPRTVGANLDRGVHRHVDGRSHRHEGVGSDVFR